MLSGVLKVVGSAGVETGLGLSLSVRKQTVTFYSCSSMRSNSVAPKTNLPGPAVGLSILMGVITKHNSLLSIKPKCWSSRLNATVYIFFFSMPRPFALYLPLLSHLYTPS